MKKYIFYHSCVGWPRREVQQLIDMIDSALTISRRTFLKHVNKEELNDIEANLSYSRHYEQGLTMAQDWHVSYHRSKLNGRRVYFFTQSGIEYVFK